MLAVLAALLAAWFAVPASAQDLRATAVRPVAESVAYGEVAAAASSTGFLVAWNVEGGTVQLRTVDAAGEPSGPVRTVALGSKYITSWVFLAADALVTVEYNTNTGARTTKLRRLDATGAAVGSASTITSGGITDVARQPDGGLLVVTNGTSGTARSVLVLRVAPTAPWGPRTRSRRPPLRPARSSRRTRPEARWSPTRTG